MEFPWRESVDAIEEVGSKNAFDLSLQLCREGLICGPSSGFNLQGKSDNAVFLNQLTISGLLNYLEKRKTAGDLSECAGPEGLINCAFICCDLPYQYLEEYFEKLGDGAFNPIHNEVCARSACGGLILTIWQHLAAVDLYRYDEAWELEPARALSQFMESTSRSSAVLLDLRKPDHFIASHVPGAYNLPLQSSNDSSLSPFDDASVLQSQWKELETTFTADRISAHDLADKHVYVICYNGDTARVATSVLRARGITASSVKGGYVALRREVPHLQMTELGRNFFKQDWSIAFNNTTRELRTDSIHGHNEVVVGPP